MSELTVASRYAKSLIDLALEKDTLEATKQDMTFFVQTLKANTQLQAVLRNPIISHDKKLKVLQGIFTGKVAPSTDAFFKIMVTKSRAELLYPTAQEFINQYNIKKNIVKATVVSATPLSEANRNQIISEVKSLSGGEVVLQEKVDAALIGGFVLTVGDRQIDTSVASSLQKLKKDFAQKVI
ncbi:ATP synthase F1 subunit delta [Mucilaginibacter terrae]|uniref:ATP synthase subunit delta n=1 Tax=Mucilaginibacter terrae TaxID=1955052 RepID=A0ABU3GSQ7_9SPHI|nr:ATP synthase F1 subunit delta [Mucilaginibacter terrae]MDT3402811.1 F-type H+-transporting ATPase subunit delta [Mucilaginibacter terrae]